MSTRRIALSVMAAAAVVVAPPTGWLAVAAHEAAHALAAWATGGAVVAVEVGADLAGATTYTGGWPALVALSGPIGAVALPAALALALAMARRPAARWLGGALAAVALRSAGDVAAHTLVAPGPGSDAAAVGAALGVPPAAVGVALTAWAAAVGVGLLAAYWLPMFQVSAIGPKPAA